MESKNDRAIKLKEIKARYDRLGWLKREDILWLLEELEKHHAAND